MKKQTLAQKKRELIEEIDEHNKRELPKLTEFSIKSINGSVISYDEKDEAPLKITSVYGFLINLPVIELEWLSKAALKMKLIIEQENN